ncbi:sensory box histidine kinase/response regulator [hydrothermal vent metagenome]|uniref:histidine kinase n=1 Tax=hydrothermal vent metagenome TaxID=652676 RepID=A0A1W1C2K9_9ZZZZ
MYQSIQELLHNADTIRLLYVEDDPFVRESTLDLLGMYFTHIDSAENGEEGIEKYRSFYEKEGQYYDLVLTDINMPKCNGIEMIHKIKKLNDRQIVIVFTAHTEFKYLIELIDLEISHFILKPVHIERFEKVLKHALEIWTQRYEYKKMTKELAQSTQKAEEATEQKSRFLANMSHEIRTPLNAINGFIKLLEENETDETKQKYLKIIKNASESLMQIINDILDISKIESGKLTIEPYTFNPYDDLINIAELFQARAAEKNIVFQVRYNNNMPKSLFGDALRIKQIFTNLLSNAIKFTPEHSKVKCVIWYKDGKLVIKVKDYGIGISEEKQKMIFEPFTQTDGSTTRNYGGTGLGLSISLELAQMLGGSLVLQSKEGKGSMFTLSIPLEESKERQEEETVENTASLKGHILIVEDYEANRMFLSIILDNAGITYEMAHDGLEAIEKFQSGTFDLILMDENMPNMNGMEAMKEIIKLETLEQRVHTPIVSLTANALQGDKQRFLEMGFDDYLSKPVEPQTLLKTIGKVLQNNTKEKEN